MISREKLLVSIIGIVFALWSTLDIVFAKGTQNIKMSATFQKQKEQYLIGEPIGVLFTLQNQSDSRVSFYIGTTRDDGFRFSAVAKQKTIQQLNPYNPEGAPVPTIRLEPSEAYKQVVFLNEYLLFELPGTYTVDCAIDIHVLPITDMKKEGIYKISIRDKVTIELYQGSNSEIQDIIKELESKLQSKDRKIRVESARALGSMRVSPVVGPLGRALRNPDGIVQWHVAHALAKIGTPEAIEELANVARSGDLAARETAIDWLGYSGVKTTIPILLNLLEDSCSTIRYAVLRALSNVGDQSCIGEVQKKLDDPDERVRSLASQVLEALMRK